MIPVTLLAKALTAATRFHSTIVAATPGRIVVRGPEVWLQVASPRVTDSFCCRDVSGLRAFIKGLRGAIEVTHRDGQVVLTAAGRKFVVSPLAGDVWDPHAVPAFSICVPRERLREAVERFARRDVTCLVHYTHDELFLEDEKGSTSLSPHRRSGGAIRVARAASGQKLRGAVMAVRTDDLDLQILGEWNGVGPIVLSERDDVGGGRLTIVVPGDPFTRARHFLMRDHVQQQPEPSLYTGLTQQECDELCAWEDRERTRNWVETREATLDYLRQIIDDPDQREVARELRDRLDWEAQLHRRRFAEGCGVRRCDVCVETSASGSK
jgi:hypothetical protein